MFLNIYHTFAFVSLLAKRLITGVSKIQKPLKYDISFDQYQILKMSMFGVKVKLRLFGFRI